MIRTQIQLEHLASHIDNIRYGVPGTVLFDFKGNTQEIREPEVFLENDSGGREWISLHYTDLLQKLDDEYNIGG